MAEFSRVNCLGCSKCRTHTGYPCNDTMCFEHSHYDPVVPEHPKPSPVLGETVNCSKEVYDCLNPDEWDCADCPLKLQNSYTRRKVAEALKMIAVAHVNYFNSTRWYEISKVEFDKLIAELEAPDAG